MRVWGLGNISNCLFFGSVLDEGGDGGWLGFEGGRVVCIRVGLEMSENGGVGLVPCW